MKKRERFEVVLIVGVIDEVEGIIDHAFSPQNIVDASNLKIAK